MNRFGTTTNDSAAISTAAAALTAQLADSLFADADQFASLSQWIDGELATLETRFADFTTESSLRRASQRRTTAR